MSLQVEPVARSSEWQLSRGCTWPAEGGGAGGEAGASPSRLHVCVSAAPQGPVSAAPATAVHVKYKDMPLISGIPSVACCLGS